jgi:ubiquinone/menaquinone biosynthesis C-methylase UbiE
MFALAGHVRRLVGIDTARESLTLARQIGVGFPNCEFCQMDATAMAISDHQFDIVLCIQNGICAFGSVEQLMRGAPGRRPGGILFSISRFCRVWRGFNFNRPD